MKAYQVEEPGKPLVCNEVETPNPQGKEVLVKTISCGVCHSDVHIHEGAFNLGGGNKLELPLERPYTLGQKYLEKLLPVGMMLLLKSDLNLLCIHGLDVENVSYAKKGMSIFVI